MGGLVRRVQSHRGRVAQLLYGRCYCPDDLLFRGSRLRRAIALLHRVERASMQRLGI